MDAPTIRRQAAQEVEHHKQSQLFTMAKHHPFQVSKLASSGQSAATGVCAAHMSRSKDVWSSGR